MDVGKFLSTSQFASEKHTCTTTVDWDDSNVQYMVLSSGDQTFTFSNPLDGATYTIIAKQPAAGAAGTLTWPGSVTWVSGAAPVLKTANDAIDVLSFVYDGTNSKYYGGSSSGSSSPAGTIMAYGGTSAPDSYLLCDGSTFSAATYASLSTILGDTYGVHSGDNYYLPDLRGRVAVGKSADTEFDTLGETGGEKEHTLTSVAAHSHSLSGGSLVTSGTSFDLFFSGGGPGAYSLTGGSVGSAGSSTPHNNIQPYLTINYIIKT